MKSWCLTTISVNTSKGRTIDIIFQTTNVDNSIQSFQVDENNELYPDEHILELVIPEMAADGNPILSIGSMAFSNVHTNIGTMKKDNESEEYKPVGTIDRLVIPESISIKEDSFFQSNILTVVLHKNIKFIPSSCFACSMIEKLEGIENIESIECKAFLSCCNLKELNIPDSVCNIHLQAFDNSGLEHFRWPSKCQVVPISCFSSCENLKEVENLNGVISIEDYAFDRSGLETPPDIPNCIYMGKMAFGTTNIKHFNWPAINHSIPCYTFYGCKNLKSVEGLDDVTSIQTGAFECCGLESFTWPQKCSTIPSKCFSGCRDLKELKIIPGVYSVESFAFNAVENVHIDLSNCILTFSDTIPHTFGENMSSHIKLPYYLTV